MDELQSRMAKKLNHWETRLLDLSRRNRMISYREGGRVSLALREPSLTELYERIVVREESLTFRRPVTEEMDISVDTVFR